MGTKKKEEFEMMQKWEVMKVVTAIGGTLPDENLEDLYDVLVKALVAENVRHYVTKQEKELKAHLSSSQVLLFDRLIKTLVKTNVG